jgi:translation initiation factor 5
MAININRNVDDAFYRYKMPRLVAKVEGKGNGIKTVIANMVDIAKALNRPPTYPTKYFGCELGAQTQFDNKNDRYIVNGDHDAAKLQDLLDGFIRRFVLCQECDNPETILAIKGQRISLTCKACGFVTNIDPRQKLTTFVIKNPPDQETPENPSVTTGKRGKKGKGGKDQPTATTPTDNGTNGTVIDAIADQEKRRSDSDEVDDEDWAVDPDDAVQRQRELQGQMAHITLNDDMEKDIDDRMKMFQKFVTEKFKAGLLDPKVVMMEAERLDVKDEAVVVLCHVLFAADPLQVANEQIIKSNRALFLRFTLKNHRAQRHLLGGLEQIVVQRKKDLLPKVPRILKLFYDEDILEEEQILKWGEKSQKKYVTKEDNKEIRSKAEPFLKWLKEAEEESDDESGEDDDDGVEVVYEAHPTKTTNGSIPNGKPAVIGERKTEDDFDIDNI